MTDAYILEAYEIEKERPIMKRSYKTGVGLVRGVRLATFEKKADFVTIRRIKE